MWREDSTIRQSSLPMFLLSAKTIHDFCEYLFVKSTADRSSLRTMISACVYNRIFFKHCMSLESSLIRDKVG